MAVMAEGAIVSKGIPAALIAELEGRIWNIPIEKTELQAYEARHNVISKHLSSGRMILRVESDALPGDGFEPATATLEDVYFVAIHASRQQIPSREVH